MTETLLVDGYNAIHTIPELEILLNKSLDDARRALKKMLHQYQNTEKSIKRIYVIYDSKGSKENRIEDLGFVKNIYVSSVSNADQKIVSILKNAKKPEKIAVLSRDNFVINHAKAMGANILSIEAFCKKIIKRERQAERPKISEEQKEEINEELKKMWGIE